MDKASQHGGVHPVRPRSVAAIDPADTEARGYPDKKRQHDATLVVMTRGSLVRARIYVARAADRFLTVHSRETLSAIDRVLSGAPANVDSPASKLESSQTGAVAEVLRLRAVLADLVVAARGLVGAVDGLSDLARAELPDGTESPVLEAIAAADRVPSASGTGVVPAV